jgi:hypothetical protein
MDPRRRRLGQQAGLPPMSLRRSERSGSAAIAWPYLNRVPDFRSRRHAVVLRRGRLDGEGVMSVATPPRESLFTEICRFFSNMSQTPQEVLVREPGWRSYGDPQMAGTEAIHHWEYALLSLVAYAKANAIKRALRNKSPTSGPEFARELTPEYSNLKFNPEAALQAAGWINCDKFVSDNLDRIFKAGHLRLEVWEKADHSALAVAFGGTVATSLQDWVSNLRWLLPRHHDEYTLLVSRFVPDFVTTFKEEFAQTPPVIYSTGHSLGGGLAQQFAYALPNELHEEGLKLPRVIQVYAFDPSPVTGFYSLERDIRMQNAKGLKTDRVFERGEVLAFVRSILALFRPPSKMNPAVRAVRYNFMGRVLPIRAHNMAKLAQALYDTTHSGQRGMMGRS